MSLRGSSVWVHHLAAACRRLHSGRAIVIAAAAVTATVTITSCVTSCTAGCADVAAHYWGGERQQEGGWQWHWIRQHCCCSSTSSSSCSRVWAQLRTGCLQRWDEGESIEVHVQRAELVLLREAGFQQAICDRR